MFCQTYLNSLLRSARGSLFPFRCFLQVDFVVQCVFTFFLCNFFGRCSLHLGFVYKFKSDFFSLLFLPLFLTAENMGRERKRERGGFDMLKSNRTLQLCGVRLNHQATTVLLVYKVYVVFYPTVITV